MANWWPPEHHILQAKLADIVFEPRQGGNIYDRGEDGSECRWARVLAYDPPRRVVFSWDISLQWELEPDPAKTSEVEVRFISEAPGRTRVELEHRAIERHGDGWEQIARRRRLRRRLGQRPAALSPPGSARPGPPLLARLPRLLRRSLPAGRFSRGQAAHLDRRPVGAESRSSCHPSPRCRNAWPARRPPLWRRPPRPCG